LVRCSLFFGGFTALNLHCKPFTILTPFVFLLVLFAALLHAGWNVIVKSNADRLMSLTVLQAFMALMGVAMVIAFGFPGHHVWPWALASGTLHLGYNLFLARAYRHADLSVVYPIARGAAPLMTLLGSMLLTQDGVGLWMVAAVVILVAGLMLTGLGNKSPVSDPHALYYALGTACWIATYTLVDGIGARQSGNVLGFAGVIFVFDGLFILVAAFFMRGRSLVTGFRANWHMGLVGGAASCIAYGIAVWAMTKAPIASVAALRETSIVFVLLLSSQVLKEKLSWQRVVGGMMIVAGASLLRFA
jgi:drug/metabolite transporter (DMT)-like permease